jgi:predicted site-specific integrase-resolvase
MKISLAQAATATGRSRSTILRTIRAGKLSAERDEAAGAWAIDLSELSRAFPSLANGHGQPSPNDAVRTGAADTMATRLAAAEARIAEMSEAQRRSDDVVDDLRRRLDAEAEERRRLTAILADQRAAAPVPRRSWWPWQRRG